VAVFIVGVLLALSVILVFTTVIPSINVEVLAAVLGGFVVVGTAMAAALGFRLPRMRPIPREERENWRMPALALMQRAKLSPVRRAAIYTLSGYLVLAILMLIVRAIELAIA